MKWFVDKNQKLQNVIKKHLEKMLTMSSTTWVYRRAQILKKIMCRIA